MRIHGCIPAVSVDEASSSTKPSPRDIHLQESPLEGEEERRVGVLGKGSRRESLASPTSTGRGSVGEKPQPRGVDVGQRNS